MNYSFSVGDLSPCLSFISSLLLFITSVYNFHLVGAYQYLKNTNIYLEMEHCFNYSETLDFWKDY